MLLEQVIYDWDWCDPCLCCLTLRYLFVSRHRGCLFIEWPSRPPAFAVTPLRRFLDRIALPVHGPQSDAPGTRTPLFSVAATVMGTLLTRPVRSVPKENARRALGGRTSGGGNRRLLPHSIPIKSALPKHSGRVLLRVVDSCAGCQADRRIKRRMARGAITAPPLFLSAPPYSQSPPP